MNQDTPPPQSQAVSPSVTEGAAGAPARVTSQSLFGAHRELVIVHNGRDYRLRLTQNGKLILTA